MIQIAMKSKGAVNRNTLLSLNRSSRQTVQMRTVQAAQAAPLPPVKTAAPVQAAQTANTAPLTKRQIPPLLKPIQKGQKVSIEANAPLHRLKACFGWRTLNPQCDVDVSAFLLGPDGKVPGDSWFVFYGQTLSPDQSTVFHADSGTDRESVTIDLQRLNPAVQKIVFVLTIHEAVERRLHFGMLTDAYVRILNGDTSVELVSFQMTEYYNNVISMMIGEIYRYNGVWKFNAVGNGVARDLAGLCALYGVQISDS
ncbi:MAG: TerD family protein [Eubacterium sp.]|nr:TerD family protein [Eubacterium sp.]